MKRLITCLTDKKIEMLIKDKASKAWFKWLINYIKAVKPIY